MLSESKENNASQASLTSSRALIQDILEENGYNMGGANNNPKTALKKEELEQIAMRLKKKLSRASATAKKSLSPTNIRVGVPRTSPMKKFRSRVNSDASLYDSSLLSSSPTQLYSPNGRSPTHMRTPAAVYLSSSPLKNLNAEAETRSDSRRASQDSNTKGEDLPQMVLQKVDESPTTPTKSGPKSLKPSPPLTGAGEQTTPTPQKRQLTGNGSATPNPLLKTPTQSRPSTNNSYNDKEGADLLMYLATSPSPAKPQTANTPRSSGENMPTLSSYHTHLSTLSAHHRSTPSNSLATFMAPPVPLTPKRHITTEAKTPQNRLTPSANLFNAMGNGNLLPSSGLVLTPAGFNMNDYVNFFTPSPDAANLNTSSNFTRNLLKTPDLNSVASAKQSVDGKMINFDKEGLFVSTSSSAEATSKDGN